MKPNRVLGIVVGCVAVLAVVAAVVAATRSVTAFDPATPEGTVQGYLQALFTGDDEAAFGYLASDTECQVDDFGGVMRRDSARVVLRDVDIDGDAAEVAVEVSYTSAGGPFDAYEWSQDQFFDLAREADGWRITGVPWPLYFCERG